MSASRRCCSRTAFSTLYDFLFSARIDDPGMNASFSLPPCTDCDESRFSPANGVDSSSGLSLVRAEL